MAPKPTSTLIALQSVMSRNAELTLTIKGLIVNNGHDEVPVGCVKDVMLRLYNNIAILSRTASSPKTSQETALAVWTSFLDPLKSLERLGAHGPFLSARMHLFLMKGILLETHLERRLPSQQTGASAAQLRERGNLLLALDDGLIECLKRILTSSRGLESFDWVFGKYDLPDSPPANPEDNWWPRALYDAAMAASRGELSALEDGTEVRHLWTRPDDATDSARSPGTLRWHTFAVQWDSDGIFMGDFDRESRPIYGKYRYRFLEGEKRFGFVFDSLHNRHVLRRSRQFVFDARRVAVRNIARERNIWARVGLRHNRLPLELIRMVMQHVRVPEIDHPYVHRLDLAQVYQPFPPVVHRCEHCAGLSKKKMDRIAKRTCPSQSIVIWNLALRAFMTFHLSSAENAPRSKYSLCGVIECQGHHTDESWRIADETQLTHAMETVIQQRCGNRATLRSVGLGPDDDLWVTDASESFRREHLFSQTKPWEEDERDELAMQGYGGLVNTMMHNRCTLAYFNYGSGMQGHLTLQNWHQTGKITTNAAWQYGRAKWQERAVMNVLKLGHACSDC